MTIHEAIRRDARIQFQRHRRLVVELQFKVRQTGMVDGESTYLLPVGIIEVSPARDVPLMTSIIIREIEISPPYLEKTTVSPIQHAPVPIVEVAMQVQYRRIRVKFRDMLQSAVVQAGIIAFRTLNANVRVKLYPPIFGDRIATTKGRLVR